MENLKVVETTENTVTLKWDDPADDGGCLITGYVIEKKEGLKRSYQRDGSTTDMQYQSIALTEGQSYVFRVAAENEVGTGEFAELSKSIAPKSQYGKSKRMRIILLLCFAYADTCMDLICLDTDPPSPPSAPKTENITKESCDLSWREPEQNGGTPITGYYIERCTTQSNRWIRITRNLVEGLTYQATELVEGTEYCFRVVAVNKVGESEPGPQSQPVLAKDPWGE